MVGCSPCLSRLAYGGHREGKCPPLPPPGYCHIGLLPVLGNNPPNPSCVFCSYPINSAAVARKKGVVVAREKGGFWKLGHRIRWVMGPLCATSKVPVNILNFLLQCL